VCVSVCVSVSVSVCVCVCVCVYVCDGQGINQSRAANATQM
jgi:hypothetical protein